jgi:hypothetical protein
MIEEVAAQSNFGVIDNRLHETNYLDKYLSNCSYC